MKRKPTLSLKRSVAGAGPERLQKVLSKAGLGSRRMIEERILRGEIEVDGHPASIGESVGDGQKIRLDGRDFYAKAVSYEGPRVLAYNKPEGEVTTTSDPEGRPTVFDRLPKLKGSRWVVVGRLDLNTAGLLLFTTDGELANRLMHPSHEIDREYLCRIHGDVSENAIKRLLRGVELDDGMAKFEEIEAIGGEGSNQWYRVLLREGRQREVRRLWDAVETEVSRLKRVRYGVIELGKDLKRGWYRELAAEEIAALLGSVDLPVAVRHELRLVPAESMHKFERGQRRERRPESDRPRWKREAAESFAERGSNPARRRGPAAERAEGVYAAPPTPDERRRKALAADRPGAQARPPRARTATPDDGPRTAAEGPWKGRAAGARTERSGAARPRPTGPSARGAATDSPGRETRAPGSKFVAGKVRSTRASGDAARTGPAKRTSAAGPRSGSGGKPADRSKPATRSSSSATPRPGSPRSGAAGRLKTASAAKPRTARAKPAPRARPSKP